MKFDILVAEIGSTTTSITAFDRIKENPLFVGQEAAPTTVGDVSIGFYNAIESLKQNLKTTELIWCESFAAASAAGGLKMSVHGLVYDMTVKAAKEAALGAGANLHMITAGKIGDTECANIKKIKPNIIMVAGGVDYGEKETVIANAKKIATLRLNIPVIYAGNVGAATAVKNIFRQEGQNDYLYITANVYPKIDVLNVNEARTVIQNVFEEHIVRAAGMEKIRTVINANIVPTPGAVMNAALLLRPIIGNLIVADIGGATTDIHSVTEDSPEVMQKAINPEPLAKRTVEGDLGVFINKNRLIEIIGKARLINDLNISQAEYDSLFRPYKEIPDEKQIPLVRRLALEALRIGIDRHAGKYRPVYTYTGRKLIPEGKDLTAVDAVVGTGGVLSRLNGADLIRKTLALPDEESLKPKPDCRILIDKHYIMAAIGVISKKYPRAARQLLVDGLEVM